MGQAVGVVGVVVVVAIPAGIVAIRTFLSSTLEMELSGRWPWQRS